MQPASSKHFPLAITAFFAVSFSTLFAGCSDSSSPRPLPPRAFYPTERRIEEDPRSEIDRNRNPSGVTFPKRSPQDPLPEPRVSPATLPATRPTTRTSAATGDAVPASAPGVSSGQYQLIGSVVAKVNGIPIYANKVLSLLNKPLTQKARELEQEQFRDFAQQLIQQQVTELVKDELLLAAAQRALTDEDQKIVDALTQQWRSQQITLAGGSLQLARSKAAAEGDDFDELVREQHRRKTVEMFHIRKLSPRVQVTVDDLRRYYDKHKDDEFTEHEAARFRLLEVSVDKTGSADAAYSKVKDKHDRAKNGEDFTEMCKKENDDARLAAQAGDMGWRRRKSLPPALSKIEEEVWQLQPGQITSIVKSGNAYYIAKLEEVRSGRVRRFNEQPSGKEPGVQEYIREKLTREQFRQLTDEFYTKLFESAAVEKNDEMLNLCLDMAMQRYHAVSRAR